MHELYTCSLEAGRLLVQIPVDMLLKYPEKKHPAVKNKIYALSSIWKFNESKRETQSIISKPAEKHLSVIKEGRANLLMM